MLRSAGRSIEGLQCSEGEVITIATHHDPAAHRDFHAASLPTAFVTDFLKVVAWVIETSWPDHRVGFS